MTSLIYAVFFLTVIASINYQYGKKIQELQKANSQLKRERDYFLALSRSVGKDAEAFLAEGWDQDHFSGLTANTGRRFLRDQ